MVYTPRDWITGEVVTEATFQAEFDGIFNSFAWTSSWTPAITATTTNPTLTFLLDEGRYTVFNKTVFASANIKINAMTNAGSGDWIFSLPIDARDPGSGFLARIGQAEVYDNSTNTGFGLTVVRSGTSLCKLRRDGTSQFVTNAAPIAWAGNDEISLQLRYETV